MDTQEKQEVKDKLDAIMSELNEEIDPYESPFEFIDSIRKNLLFCQVMLENMDKENGQINQ